MLEKLYQKLYIVLGNKYSSYHSSNVSEICYREVNFEKHLATVSWIGGKRATSKINELFITSEGSSLVVYIIIVIIFFCRFYLYKHSKIWLKFSAIVVIYLLFGNSVGAGRCFLVVMIKYRLLWTLSFSPHKTIRYFWCFIQNHIRNLSSLCSFSHYKLSRVCLNFKPNYGCRRRKYTL